MTMEAATPKPDGKRPLRALLRAFLRRRDGSTAIEFSILVIPFALLVFAILESCISFAAQQVMTNATDDVARMYRTGQIRPRPPEAESKLRNIICERMEIMVSAGCPGLEVDLRTYSTFAEIAALRTPMKNGDIDTEALREESGGATSKNILRVYYRWPIITDIMRYSMSTINGGKVLHYASVTWQNEPYAD